MSHVRMTNEAGEVWDAPESFVEQAKEQGWKAAKETSYDPGEHTVEQVLAHLKKSDPAETQRVLDAERAGQNRSTITGD